MSGYKINMKKTLVYKLLYLLGMKKTVSNLIYFRTYGKKINWNNPVTLNEKLMILKHNDYMNNPLVVKCADKVGIREYVHSKGCDEILTELCGEGVYSNVSEIVWEQLPNQFALKCSHGCNMNIIINNKSRFDKEEVFKQLKYWQSIRFGYENGEWHYLDIEPRILCEKYYGSENGRFPVDYKLFCMNGIVRCIEVCTEREKGHAQYVFMDCNWNRLFIESSYVDKEYLPGRPSSLEKMIQYARVLSSDFPFVRVDFYEFDKQVVLSELTFTPAHNCIQSINNNGQNLLGKFLELKQ